MRTQMYTPEKEGGAHKLSSPGAYFINAFFSLGTYSAQLSQAAACEIYAIFMFCKGPSCDSSPSVALNDKDVSSLSD